MRWSRLLRLGGSAAHHGTQGSKEYGGFHAPHVDPRLEYLATGMGTVMWFWIFYRAREDGPVVIGLVKPWDAHAHHGPAHGEEHGEEGHGEQAKMH